MGEIKNGKSGVEKKVDERFTEGQDLVWDSGTLISAEKGGRAANK